MVNSTLYDKYFRKWIIANMFGTYSISTIAFTNTSRWDSLLSILGDRRYNLLGKLWEIVIINDNEYLLDTSDFGDIIHPEGYKYISGFETGDSVKVFYNLGSSTVIKELKLTKNKNMLRVRYQYIGNEKASIKIFPLLQLREASLLNNNGRSLLAELIIDKNSDIVRFRRNNLAINSDFSEKFISQPDVYYNFHYFEDDERGYEDNEDLLCPGFYEFSEFNDIELRFWTYTPDIIPNDIQNVSGKSRIIPEHIWRGADIFINHNNLIAGFPWFDYWSRDAFISIPGLLLVRGLHETAKIILLNWMSEYKDGRIPNRWGGDLYSSDSPLWLIYSIKKYIDYSNDSAFLYKSVEFIKGILDNYIDGYDGIKLNGYFIYSPPGRTWMDAVCGGNNITPREGEPIEVNALWYNSLKTFQEFLIKINSNVPENYLNLIMGFEERFKSEFINGNMIKDVAKPDDYSLRPNFLIASFLPYPSLINLKPFNGQIEKLVTPYGIRSLSYDDPKFMGVYMGNQCKRDYSYHNGSIWPWLIGPYVTSMVRMGKNRDNLSSYFKPVLEFKYVPEIFDGLMPGNPRGAYAQAWSYAEIIRTYKEDLKT